MHTQQNKNSMRMLFTAETALRNFKRNRGETIFFHPTKWPGILLNVCI